MLDGGAGFSAQVRTALDAHIEASPQVVARLKVELAQLVLDHAPPAGRAQLELAQRHLAGEAVSQELLEARQDCWSYVGQLACGCSVADSASAQAVLVCLEPDAGASTFAALGEQVERVLRCGAPPDHVLRVLRA